MSALVFDIDALPERFRSKIRLDSSGCWIWTAGRQGGKWRYGAFHVPDPHWRVVAAHRYAYEMLVGPIPEGLQIDHLCRVPECVNPAHLEPVTNQENTMRGLRGRLVTHCKRGHELTPENLAKTSTGRRACRTCHNMHHRRYRAMKKEDS